MKGSLITKKEKSINPYVPQAYKVLQYVQETQDSFTITVDMKIRHDPGQFVQVSIPGFGECPISICSYSDKYVKLNIRKVGVVTNALADLKKGDTVFIRGPYGTGYPMELFSGNDVIIIGGGCGVAPLKGVIDYVEQNRTQFRDVYLFLGYRSEDDIIFKREVKEWQKKHHVSMTLDKKAHSHLCYESKQGFVTDALEESGIRNENKIVFICGPPVMMKHTVDALQQQGFNDDQIYVSAERLMYCAIGICCHCMIRGKFTCVDGPVFRYDTMRKLEHD